MSVRILFFWALVSIFHTSLKGQDWEIGLIAGASLYQGDLNTNASFEYLGPTAGFFGRFNMGSRFAVRFGFNYGQVSFEDRASPDDYQRLRNLSFRSNILELGAHIEFNFFKYDKMRDDRNFTPYMLFGISGFYFNPKGFYNGEWTELQPLGTEGQNDPELNDKGRYKRVSFAIPVGGGVKYAFHPRWSIGLEGGFRLTFTDYLDDVSTVYPGELTSIDDTNSELPNTFSDRSAELGEPIGNKGKQRGDALRNDRYLFLGLTLAYSIIEVKCPKITRIGF